MKLRRILAISAILCMTLAFAANAADFPSRTIRLIVPFAAGGSTDLTSRIIAPAMSKSLKNVDIIVENRAGGGGAMAMMELVQAAPDGHVLALVSQNASIMTPILSDVGFTKVDIAPVAQVAELPTNVFVKADSEVNTVADLIRLGEKNYGKMTYSTSGTGSIHHVVAELFQHTANKKGLLTHVPYNSGTESITAVLGGHVDMAFANASYGESYVKQQGVMKMVATTAEDESMFPDVPTFRSLGYDVAISSWWGIVARAGTPPEILDMIDKAVKDAVADPEVGKAMENLGMPPDYIGRTDFTIKYLSQYDQLGGVLAGLF